MLEALNSERRFGQKYVPSACCGLLLTTRALFAFPGRGDRESPLMALSIRSPEWSAAELMRRVMALEAIQGTLHPGNGPLSGAASTEDADLPSSGLAGAHHQGDGWRYPSDSGLQRPAPRSPRRALLPACPAPRLCAVDPSRNFPYASLSPTACDAFVASLLPFGHLFEPCLLLLAIRLGMCPEVSVTLRPLIFAAWFSSLFPSCNPKLFSPDLKSSHELAALRKCEWNAT